MKGKIKAVLENKDSVNTKDTENSVYFQEFIETPPFATPNIEIENVTDFSPLLPHPIYISMKRIFDVVFGISLLFLMLPFFAVICLLIVLESTGSPIYRQPRKGKGQKLFMIYKFRTMIQNAHSLRPDLLKKSDVGGSIFKLKNDPRVTFIGKILRYFSFDELPQIWNVIKGEMSFIGPRPFIFEDFQRPYHAKVKFQYWNFMRHQIVPGITGLWQVSGRNDLPFEDLMKLDLMYVSNCNFWMDLKILFKTIPAVFGRRGSY